MPQLLIEFFSEEIPARMQKRAEEDLARAFGEKLKSAGLEAKAIKTYSTPRRLALVIDDLPAKAADVNEEKKGPRVGAPDQAIQGFLKSAGLKAISEAEIVADKKGDFYVARIQRAGGATSDIVRDVVPEIVRAFPWPKSMRSGTSDLVWVRPLHNVLCLFDGKAVKIELDGVGSQALTWGHRFHAPGAIEVRDGADYAAKLRAAHVLLDREERKRVILDGAKKHCADAKLDLVDDAGLLEEVAGLVEWPVVLMGEMDPSFLDLPSEVIRLSMRTHQKFFAVRDGKTQKLAPRFITVANVEAKDGGKAIAAGNSRVLSARLNDARFFWDTDRKTPLFTDERREKLKKIVFHQKLGSVWGKVERVKALAVELCAVTGADKALVERAAELCKMDLVTETVGEFPELQGQVGRQLYALEKGANASIAAAIEDHYRPLGPNDRVPNDKVAVTLALADKLDTLVGFWLIDERPSGSGDPYALRRAGLGFLRILLQSRLQLRLVTPLIHAYANCMKRIDEIEAQTVVRDIGSRVGSFDPSQLIQELGRMARTFRAGERKYKASQTGQEFQERFVALAESLLEFLYDRLVVHLKAEGVRHDAVIAVLWPHPEKGSDFDLVRIVARVEALDAFLKTEDGANLLAGSKRAANILAAEAKKGRIAEGDLDGAIDAALLQEPQEKALNAALEAALPKARAAVEKEDFAAAMKALAPLRAPVDAFFEKVLVNADDAMLRRNRLRLLSTLGKALSAVADFSKIEGQ